MSPRSGQRVAVVPLEDWQPDPDSGHAEGVELRVTLSSAWKRLPDHDRRILQLVGEGLTHKQVASVMGLSLRTSERHYERARRALSRELYPA